MGYAAFVAALTVVQGVPLTPDVILVAAAFALLLTLRGRMGALRDWTPFVILFLAYELMRGLADDAGFPVHLADALAVERWLFLGNLPTAVLQDWLRPASGPDLLALLGTVVYLLHFPLPVLVGVALWRWRPHQFRPFLVALILLSFSGFVSYLLLPVAPPWMAAEAGLLDGPSGAPTVAYLKPDAFAALVGALGFDGSALYDVAFRSLNANPVAAFPSLHAAYPFLAFLVARSAFPRYTLAAFAYFGLVSLTIVYTADHYVIDVIGGVVYAAAAYLLMRRMVARRSS